MVKHLKSSFIRRTRITFCDIVNNVFSWQTCKDCLTCPIMAAYHAHACCAALHRVVLKVYLKVFHYNS